MRTGFEQTAEQRILALAAKQFGVVSAEQCTAEGVSKGRLTARVTTGAWRRVHRGVYALGPARLNRDQREMAALLLGGVGAALSHHTAAARHWISTPKQPEVQLLLPWEVRRRTSLSGVQLWRARGIDLEADVTSHGPFRVTKVGRTMLDLSSVLDDTQLRVALDSALRARRTSFKWIQKVLEDQGRGHRGAARLRELMREYSENDEISDSELESMAMELGLRTGRKPVLHQVVLSGGDFVAEIDLGWPHVRLGVELDSWRFHGDKAAFQRDRERDRRLALLGWQVLRYTWLDVTRDKERFVREVLALHDARLDMIARERTSLVQGLEGRG